MLNTTSVIGMNKRYMYTNEKEREREREREKERKKERNKERKKEKKDRGSELERE